MIATAINSYGYRDFIEGKSRRSVGDGFEPLWIPDYAKDFQRYLVDWLVRIGRGAAFADCGLGKTLIELIWAQNVYKKTGKPVLVLTPLAVSAQTAREGDKFQIECSVSRDGKIDSPIVTTNYERLHYFDVEKFGGVVCDESGAIKNYDAQRTGAITEFMKRVPYRMLATATPAPNDMIELGTSSEALGYFGYRDMVTRFFREEIAKDQRGWARTKYRFRGHAQQPFWQWVCSWARSLRRTSDLGFSDVGYDLPPLNEREVTVATAKPRKGTLFTVPARNMEEERAERKHSIRERCEKAVEIANAVDGPCVLWGELNPEWDMLEDMLDDCVQISGSMKDDQKEEYLEAFSSGQIRRLVTKPKIGAWGLNWQHCADTVVFPSHSFEQYYQLVRRFYRFGQTKPVNVSLVMCEGQSGIGDNLRRKQQQTEQMFAEIVAHMADALHLNSLDSFPKLETVPTWL